MARAKTGSSAERLPEGERDPERIKTVFLIIAIIPIQSNTGVSYKAIQNNLKGLITLEI